MVSTGMDSASSVRSVHSTHSNTTIKASTLNTNNNNNSSTAFPYTVGRLSTFHDTDTDMEDPFAIQHDHSHPHSQGLGLGPAHHHSRHRIDSQGVPIPPARTTSLAQHTQPLSSHSISESDTLLPSVQVTTATPTKRQNESHRPYTGPGQYHNSLGHGSLDITEDHGHGQGQGYSFPHYSSSNDQLNSYTSVEDDSDLDPEFRQIAVITEEDKMERTRRQGRDRQRRKRAKDKEEKVSYSLFPSSDKY